ncbi:uncharacterized protein LOC125246108 [Megalobrama amblycephala]|uniref:uncharacterized protein LOC125246108 n=1 Tax=Megalobrama amblycephala TaxID=75352 RepID=UPI002013DFF1|nr:uncharacterized protein LOC125246108 [Megalobrama amblycephala]
MATVKIFPTIFYLLQYSCFGSDVNCNHGECNLIEDTTQVFCECNTMLRGPECTLGRCCGACLDNPCGVNAKCSSSNHGRTCTCESPWKGDPYQGCRNQDLQWIQTGAVPSNAVLSKTKLAVCKAIASDGGWHSGFVKDHRCNYEYDSSSHQANSYEVLVDPCGGRGWKWMEGEQGNMVSYDESKRFPGVRYFVCSEKSFGLVGKLFRTRHGFMCHIARDGDKRDGNFFSLVQQPCI